MDDLISRQAEQQGRVFKEIVVEYPSYNTYPEYEGKPYFSIKYTENGQEFIGYGTYKPEVLSEYLKEYFMPSAQTDLIAKIQNGIKATDLDDIYFCGMRNGMRWCISLIDGKEPLYENCPSAQPEQQWTSSGKKPPEEEGSYLVWMPFAPPKHRITVAEYCGGYWNIKTPISAWMPLPAPYRGGKNV